MKKTQKNSITWVGLKISNQFKFYFVFSLIYKLTNDFFLLKTAAFDWVVWFIVPNTKEIIIIYRYIKNAKNVPFFVEKLQYYNWKEISWNRNRDVCAIQEILTI